MTSTRIFVYGTLKEGFPNFHVNGGRRVPGRYVTARRFSLFIVGPDHVPWLVDEGEGKGEHVEGELYDVAPADLPRMDALEGIGLAGGYRRVMIEVRKVVDDEGALGPPQGAHVYLQDMAHRQNQEIHAGPLNVYTRDQAARYRDD